MAATKIKKPDPLRKTPRPNSVLFPRLTKLAAACRAAFWHHAKAVELHAQSTKFLRTTPAQPNHANRSAALNALLLSALALPGMVGTAHASSDDVIKGTTAKINTLPSLDDTARADEDQEIGIQYSHYREGARTLLGPVVTGTLPATAGSTVSGTTYGIADLPRMNPITADGEHAYAKFRLGDRTRIGIDFVQDVWSGASPLATLPSNMITGASVGHSFSGYFNAQGKPVFNTQYQANANPNNASGAPQKNVYSLDNRIGHAMGYASAETRKQTTIKYGYDWDDTSIDVGVGVSSEVDFLSKFGNVAYHRDLNDKRTSINIGLSYTHGDTHAEWNANGRENMGTDAYPGQFTQYNVPGVMVHPAYTTPYTARLITGTRDDVALTGGVTQVVNKNDVVSTGFGYTHTTGFLSNPWKGAVVLFPDSPAPSVLAAYPSISYWTGKVEMERRPSLRNQFTWDTSYLHYFEHQNAAGQLHYSLFVDSWGIIAHTIEGEWRQSLGNNWIVTPRLRYYTQSAANFYAPYFFTASPSDLANRYFSSDERLSGFGTITPGVSITKKLARGLKLETGLEYSARSGSFKMGGNQVGPYADLKSLTFNIALRGSLDGSAAKSDSNMSMHTSHIGHHTHEDIPAGVMSADMMNEPGEVMLAYRLEQTRLGGTMMQGSQTVANDPRANAMWITGMTMNMQMLELMVAQNNWLNWMVMPRIVDNKMGMFMNEIISGSSMSNMGMRMHSFMASGGVGDTEISALIRLWDQSGEHLHLSQGISVPTGSVNEREANTARIYPYDMQPGSGTWDYKPSITYTGTTRNLNWGVQLGGTIRLQNRNSSGYSLGNETQVTAWGGYRLAPWLNATLRGLYSEKGAINGQFSNPGVAAGVAAPRASDNSPANYGGSFGDVGIGFSSALGTGTYANNRISIEYLKPVHTNFNGTQNNRVSSLFLSGKFMF